MTLDVVLPVPSGRPMVTGGTSTLGYMVMGVGPLDVTLTLLNGMPPIVMGAIVKVTVVVDVTKTVAGAPFVLVVVTVPYSNDVTYWLGEMVVDEPSELVGKTSTHGAEQLTVGLLKTSGPTYTTLSLSAPGSGSQTLTSVVKPR